MQKKYRDLFCGMLMFKVWCGDVAAVLGSRKAAMAVAGSMGSRHGKMKMWASRLID